MKKLGDRMKQLGDRMKKLEKSAMSSGCAKKIWCLY